MNSQSVLKLFVGSTVALFAAALITPIASVAINFNDATTPKTLEFVCAYCQYGAVDNNPDNTAMIWNLTPWNFYFMWIPILLMIAMSLLGMFKAFPEFGMSEKISSRLMMNTMWTLAVFALIIRGLLSILIRHQVGLVQNQFPNYQIIGELSWGAAALVIGAIMAASSGMMAFIEFEYELEPESETSSVTT